MTRFLVFVLSVSLYVSCSKDVSKPDSNGNALTDFYYKDSNVGVSNFTASETSIGLVTVNFKTSFESDVTKIELMSSGDVNHFCTIDVINTSGNSISGNTYSFTDNKLKGNPMYYMLRFTYANGDWSFTPYFSIKIH